MSDPALTRAQTHALFDVLIHHQLYSEIEAFKYPNAIEQYGFPFHKADGVQTTSPLLQNMLNKFVMRLPGLKNVGQDFWQDKVRVLVQKLGDAELSESYDKGSVGARKALATAMSSLLEYVARGMLGGYPAGERREEGKEYDASKSEDVHQAWDDGMRELIYGGLLDELFDKVAQSGKLEQHSSMVQAAHEYLLLNLASFLHHVFVMSPDGQYLLRLLENVHRLIPYMMIRQTLRVGNAATMINGMVRLILAKLSVTAVTNWIGLTNNTNDGMNLMQQIMSTVMAWDTSEFQKRAQKLENCKDSPKKGVFKAIKTHIYSSKDKHDAARNISLAESKSIIGVILETSDPPMDPAALSDHQHTVALEYYSNYLSIRDREELTKILCKLQPDVLTSAMKDLVAAFDPIIRAVHKAVDLSDTLYDAEVFLTDLIKVSKPKKPSGTSSKPGSRGSSPGSSHAAHNADSASTTHVPTVEDYVQLLRKHMPSAHKFLHQVCKNDPDLANQYREYSHAVLAEFRVNTSPSEEPTAHGAGNMTLPLQSLFSTLSTEKQDELKKLLDHHEKHLQSLKKTSQLRLQTVMPSHASTSSSKPKSATGTTHGPGMYLSRWNSLLDSCYITPAALHGHVRRGWEVKGEPDMKGMNTSAVLNNASNTRMGSRDRNRGVSATDGTGDAVERRERKRDGLEEDRVREVWKGMEMGWVGVCRGLEVMGD
ncbi:hypothetical protein P171DRAFT_389682 [Karstenula rhodostoma CBS 690.94]|uniref:PX-associated-domain-containing protein n=1 Tax=Karstenula rhodostoma CBS 690.94 TaxID=1392251 RepID=A0A9P4PEB1_9PLEO|nr:hypothetical protein P171DRAFT_389682 [Karstenula rhodostoma CBS 690.94]